jgi:hypothetical protein
VDEPQLLGTKIEKRLIMEKSSANKFKDEFGKEFSKVGGQGLSDAMKYMTSFQEGVDDEDDDESTKKGKYLDAKSKFDKDLQDDPDFIEFKKKARYKDDGQTRSFGVPRASGNDPFVKKKKYSRVKNSETKEATGSGSSGAYSGPVFGGGDNDEFWEKSRSETPKLKESEVEKVEATEATTSGSVGGYETPAMWAKSTSKKDWGPSRKTQYPGGGFVKIKKKCTKFPYCNQGDINNLKISKNESVKEAIQQVSKKLGLTEDVIITILEHEYEMINKRIK